MEDWEESEYDVVKGKNGEYYHYYTQKNKNSGEVRFLVAKYLGNMDGYLKEEDFFKLLDSSEISNIKNNIE